MKPNAAQLATILAALRTYQRAGYGEPSNRPDDIHEIATDDNRQISLDDTGIDTLCEELNVASADDSDRPDCSPAQRFENLQRRESIRKGLQLLFAGHIRNPREFAGVLLRELETEPEPQPISKDPAERLKRAQEAQIAYWDALRDLETAVGMDLEDVGELAGLTVKDVIESYGPDGFGGTDEAPEPDPVLLQRHFDDYGEDPGHGRNGTCEGCRAYFEYNDAVADNLRRAEMGGARDPRNDRD